MQNQLRITLHQINEHISEETVGPRKPRTRVRIHIIQVEALMHVSVRRALLQYLQASLSYASLPPSILTSEVYARMMMDIGQM